MYPRVGWRGLQESWPEFGNEAVGDVARILGKPPGARETSSHSTSDEDEPLSSTI